jgi:CRP-like cAMP-binding protein
MFSSILAQIGHFSAQEVLIFGEKVKRRSIAKNDYILTKGEVCKSAFVILQGAFIQFNYQDEIEQNVIDLHLSNEWVINHQSFTKQRPSENFIQAYIDSEVLELSVEDLHSLIAISPKFLQLGKILEQATARLHFFDNRLSPLEKYLYILENKPSLVQAFPLKIIASYLKITPETLSRVRENLARGKNLS